MADQDKKPPAGAAGASALEKRLLNTSDPEKRAELRRELERRARERETR